MLKFKIAKEGEILLIQELAHTIWHSHYPGIISVEQIEYMLDLMYSANCINKEITDGHKWVLLLLKDQPVGFLSYIFESENRKVKLNKLYILSSFHGNGYGQQSLNYVKTHAKDLQASILYLTVNKQNKKAIDAYLKAGFYIDKNIITDIGHGYIMDDYIMAFDIN
jgi:RimJ/RimL family protein N-acetyltransferase